MVIAEGIAAVNFCPLNNPLSLVSLSVFLAPPPLEVSLVERDLLNQLSSLKIMTERCVVKTLTFLIATTRSI